MGFLLNSLPIRLSCCRCSGLAKVSNNDTATSRGGANQNCSTFPRPKTDISIAPTSPHLLVSINEKVIEILDANQFEPRIFHVRNSIERDRQSNGENHHVNPAARRGRGHAEASK